ncbi:MAG: DUF2726 domain-containing protein [Syntrophomonadaceae bacterium]|nr:DUF2726 domain-containing protein [Syntrophomonadaceae bacterium]
MIQIIAIVLLLVLGKLAYDYFVKGSGSPLPGGRYSQPMPRRKPQPQRGGNLIDISDTWVDTSNMPYRSREYPLNNKEFAIYNLLRELIDTKQHIICPKIRMSDLVAVNPQDDKYTEYTSRLRERSVDLAIFNPADLKLQLVISVESGDDQRTKQIKDQYREKALRSAHIPLLKLNPRDLDTESLKEDLSRAGLTLNP